MMRTLRTNMKIILWAVVVAFIGTIFVVWGMKGEYAFKSPQTLAVVNGEEISYSEFYPLWQKQLDQYREIYKDKFTDEMTGNLKEMIVQQLVMQKLMLKTAKNMKIDVSIEEIAKKIKKYPVFLNKDGSFNEEKYNEIIKNTNVPWNEIEKEERNSLVMDKLQDLIINSVKVSDEEVRFDYIMSKETVKAKYIFVEFEKFKEKNLAKKKIEEIKNRLNSGVKFEELAKENGGSKETEEFSRKQSYLANLGNAVNFVRAAFSLKMEGAVSDPVEAEKGYAILKISSRKGIDEEKFNKEKENLKFNLKTMKGYSLYSEWIQELKNKAKIKIFSENIKNI